MMKELKCNGCGKTTQHNSRKQGANKEPEFRCTACGYPQRVRGSFQIVKNGKLECGYKA